ncbi:MAG: CAP domain-containing protein [Myxococcota bacterium]
MYGVLPLALLAMGCIFGSEPDDVQIGTAEGPEDPGRQALIPRNAPDDDGSDGVISSTDCPVDETPFACEVIELVNAERSSRGMAPYGYNAELALAAYLHAQDMSLQNYFSHTSLDGRRFDERIEQAGYDAFPRGENIAQGYTTPEDVMVGWMNSPGHRANILDGMATELGVGFYPSGNYWVQNFGTR